MKKNLFIIFLSAFLLLLFEGCAKKDTPTPSTSGSKKTEAPKPYQREKDFLHFSIAPYESPLGTVFTYQDEHSKKVTLVGDFNNWNPRITPMKKNDWGIWEKTVPLKKGRVSYKFNVDGEWVLDPKNPKKVVNETGDERSLFEAKIGADGFFKTVGEGWKKAYPPIHYSKGILFTYKDVNSDSVTVAGDFNDWDKGQYPLKMNDNGIWSTMVKIDKGIYHYKFFSDNGWVPDPNNTNSGLDEYGQPYSILKVTNNYVDIVQAPHVIDRIPYKFKYYNKNLPSHLVLSVIGDFNTWDDSFDHMFDRDQVKTWECVVYMKAGDHVYRFKAGNEEFLDPYNPKTRKMGDGSEASLLELFKPPNREFVKFTYKNHLGLVFDKMFIAGDFNNWNTENQPLEYDRDNNYWFTVIDLPKGRYKYKYYIEGLWDLDPANPDVVEDREKVLYSAYTVR